MNKNEISNLKMQGFILQNDGKHFALRIKTDAGCMDSEKIDKLSEISKKYGRNYISFTVRLCVEIPWINYEDIPKIKEELKNSSLISGGTGNTVRPLVACKGTVCTHGLIDSQKICNELDSLFFGKKLPHKFKIGISGCPNNCAKAQLNDVGIIGQRIPKINEENCNGCTLCLKSCSVDAITIVDKKAVVNYEKCVNCGKCGESCKRKCISLKDGVLISVGGKFGKKYKIGENIGIYDAPNLEKIVSEIMDYFKENADSHERFGDTIDRTGISSLKEKLKDY